MGCLRGKEQHVIAFAGKSRLPSGFAQDTLATVSEDRISQSLRRNEGDSCRAAFVASHNCHADEPIVDSHAMGENPPKILLGLDGLH